ncbi:MAG: hypothetical protein EP329_20390 [Deltaproteobacteria bacterium]|nr:MAG: hypothetical protein EP329_20390 [Deltaproteobacteria bacterium]
MRRIVPLSSLTAGRCFTHAETPKVPDEDEKAKRFQTGISILQADMVWKVGVAEADGVHCESALGEAAVLAPDTKVVEVPRQGFDRLAQRAREAGAS